MSNKWRKFRQLTGAERRLLAMVLLLLPLIAASLRFVGLRRLQHVLDWLPSFGSGWDDRNLNDRIQATARMVSVAVWNGLYRANCLSQSLTLWWLLKRQGIRSDLRIGVRKADGEFQAHAWVEHQGCVLNDVDDVADSYLPFAGSLDLQLRSKA